MSGAQHISLNLHFERRYKSFWAEERKGQRVLLPPPELDPHPIRLQFDMDVAKAIGVNITKGELIAAYKAVVEDMIVTRGLRKD